MRNNFEAFKVMMTAVGGYLGWFLGGWDGFLYALVVFICLDYVTGVMVAILEKRLSSEVGFRGTFKKMMIFILVAVGHIIDTYVIGNGGVVRTAVIFFYLSNEGISILENSGKIGLPIPDKLTKALEHLNDEKEDKGDEG